MNQKLFLAISSVAALIMVGASAQEADAAVYMDFGDFPGEATKEPHVDWINVSSVSVGIDRPASSSSSRGGIVLEEIEVEKEVDKSTPKILESIVTGKVHDKVVIDFTSTFGEREVTYLSWELEKVRVSNYSFEGSAEDVLPVDTFQISFESLKVIYTQLDDVGNKGETVEFSIDKNRTK